MSLYELTGPVKDEAALALQFAAEKQHLSLHGVDAPWVAEVVTRRAIIAASNAGELVPKERHDAEVGRLKRREAQLLNWWSGAKVEADRQAQRAQAALAELENRELAKMLADKIGVILPEEPGAAAPHMPAEQLEALARVEKVRQELFDLSNDDDWPTQLRAAYRDASRAIYTALH